MVNFLDLPDDIFEHLCQYLTVRDALRLEVTCTKCYDLVAYHYWRHFTSLNLVPVLRNNSKIDVSNAYKFDSAAAGLIKRVGPVLTYLNLSKFGPLEYGLRLGLELAVIDCCNVLHTLELNNRLLDRDWLLQVSLATSQLKCLFLNHVYIRSYGGLDDQHLSMVLKGWRRLQSLSVRDNKNVKLSCSASLPVTLTSLDVQGCSLSLVHLQQTLRHCHSLETLCLTYPPVISFLDPLTLQKIQRLEVDSSCVLIGEDRFSQGLSFLTNLRSLTVCSQMTTDVLFKTVACYLLHLEEVSFPGAKRGFVTSATYALLELTVLPNLKKISLRGNVMARTLLMVCSKFPALAEIDVSYAVKDRDLVDAYQDIRSDVLEILVMRGFCPPTQDSRQVIRRLFSVFRNNCPLLKRIVI